MLFNSVIFIVLFLPIVLLGWYILQRLENPVYAKLFLVGMSLWFYGYYNPWYLGVLIASLIMNYLCALGFEIQKRINIRKLLFACGLAGNIGLLFYFKYFNFFLENCNYILHTDWQVETILLPLGISFFTFQQISFLVDRYKERAPQYAFWDYACFVTFFPQLIAGPIVLHSEFLPQLQQRRNRFIQADIFFDGISLFILGMSKKVLLADVLAIVVNVEYAGIYYLDAPAAWITIICYMLQLYFDFSGYCDMARGIGYMFGFVLPENFDSPLMAVSVKDFWHRWHMTLSRFLSTYIYFPLGGNRRGKWLKCRNLLIVFGISGIWHGANWTFVVWGLLHGIAMVWETLLPKLKWPFQTMNRLTTFLFVTISFSVFRSDSLEQAGLLLHKLFLGGNQSFVVGLSNTLQIPETYIIRKGLEMLMPQMQNLFYIFCMVFILVLSGVLVAGPKAEQWIEKKGRTWKGLFLLATLFVWSFISLSQVSTFLYFNF